MGGSLTSEIAMVLVAAALATAVSSVTTTSTLRAVGSGSAEPLLKVTSSMALS